MYDRCGKRALDVAAALAGLVLLAPLMALVACLVWWRLGRPLMFVQRRSGRGGRCFPLLKFRSMAVGDGPDEERLCGFGRRLRASGLDELPQLVNVLRGEMSLVGPRPLPPHYLRLYSPRQAIRLRARPGLAGPGVAAGRNAVPWPMRLELDAAYGETPPSLAQDLRLLALSLRVWLTGQGTHANGHATTPPFAGEGDGLPRG